MKNTQRALSRRAYDALSASGVDVGALAGVHSVWSTDDAVGVVWVACSRQAWSEIQLLAAHVVGCRHTGYARRIMRNAQNHEEAVCLEAQFKR